MRKVFEKVMVGAVSLTLVATLAFGANIAKSVKAEDASEPVEVTYSNWSFSQGGQYVPSQAGNEGYIGSVTMNGTNEQITGWLKGNGEEQAANNPSVGQKQSATQASKGFTINIENTGWDAQWNFSPYRINPWSVQAFVDVPALAGHDYKVEFTASADEKKYAYVAFGGTIKTDEGDVAVAPYGEDVIKGNNQVIALGTTEKTFTYEFTNWAGLDSFKATLMLGAFDAQQDFAGNDISSIVTAVENGWHGNVYVSNFTVTDMGLNSDYTEVPTAWQEDTTKAEPATKKPVTPSTTKPATVKKFAQVKKVKAKAKKKGKVSISWKKIAKVKKYKIKVGSQTFTSKTNKKTVKIKGKAGKTLKVKVRALAANGYKAGKWSKTVKVKIKK